MKKNFLFLSVLAVAMAFTACSTDGDDVSVTNESATSSSAPALSTITTEPLTLKFDAADAPFKEVSLTETHKAIITLRSVSAAAKSRAGGEAEGEKDEYIVGTYTFDGTKNSYLVKDEAGKDYCTLEVTDKETGKKKTVKIHLMSGSEMEEFAKEFEAEEVEKLASDDITSRLCREWTVVTTRIRHHSGEKEKVDATKVFERENGEDPASLNEILDYAKTVATINEELDEGTVITSIEFIGDGKFCFFFKNGNHYIGKWHWDERSKGYLNYEWDDKENMGNKFMKDGQAIFDVRPWKTVKYYVLTIAATIEEKDNTYKVDLSFYMKEK